MSELFNELVPEGAEIIIRAEGTQQRLIIRHERPKPVWLLQYARKAQSVRAGIAGAPGRQPGSADVALDAALVQLVRLQPGHGRTHYERLPPHQGGLMAAQERKEWSMDRLLAAGQVRRIELSRAVGRKTHGIWPAAENSL